MSGYRSALAVVTVVWAAGCGAGPAQIDSIVPSMGPASGGTVVEIQGANFLEESQVHFGEAEASAIEWLSATLIRATTPANGAGTVDVSVSDVNGTATLPNSFTYRAGPSVENVDPSFGLASGGTGVLITGTGFLDGATVTFGGMLATEVAVMNETTIAAVTPRGPVGFVDVAVENPDEQSDVLADAFEYRDSLACAATIVEPGFAASDISVRPTLRVAWDQPIEEAARLNAVTITRLGGESVAFDAVASGESELIINFTSSLRFWSSYGVHVRAVSDRRGETCAEAAGAFTAVEPSEVPQESKPASAAAVALDGDILVAVSTSFRGLQLWDVGDPSTVRLISEFHTDFRPRSVQVRDHTAFVAAGVSGVYLMDVSDPRAPAIVGRAGTPGLARDVVAFDSSGMLHIAIADGAEGTRIYRIDDPEAPTDLGTVESAARLANADSRALHVVGTRLAVANGQNGFTVYDISNPASAFEVGHNSPTAGRLTVDVSIIGEVLYVANGSAFVNSYDLTRPDLPALHQAVVCNDCSLRFPPRLQPSGTTLRVAAALEGIKQLATTSDGEMTLSHRASMAGLVFDSAESDTHLFVGGEAGVASYGEDIEPLAFDPMGHGHASSILAHGNHIYVPSRSRGLRIFDGTQVEAPTFVTQLDTPASLTAEISAANVHALDGALALADGRGGLVLYNLTDPESPTMATQLLGRDRIGEMTRDQNRLFACEDNAGIMVLDVADVTNPSIVAQVSFSAIDATLVDQCYGIELDLETQTAFVAGARGVTIVNLSDLEDIGLVGRFELRADDRVLALGRADGLLYLSTLVQDFEGRSGLSFRLQVFDVSEPATPERVFISEDLGWAGDIAIADDLLFMAAGDLGVHVFELASGALPLHVGTIPTSGDAVALHPTPQTLYVAMGNGGLGVIHTGALPAR